MFTIIFETNYFNLDLTFLAIQRRVVVNFKEHDKCKRIELDQFCVISIANSLISCFLNYTIV